MKRKLYDRRIARTRQALNDALIETLKTKPMDRISVKELCERADINRSTFYLHYESLQDLYQMSVESLYEEVRQSLERFVEKDRGWLDMIFYDGEVRLPIIRHILSFLYDNRGLIQVLIAADEHGDFLKPFYESGKESVLQTLRESGAPVAESVAVYYYHYVASGLIGLTLQWVENGMKESPDEITALLEHLIAYGAAALRRPEIHTDALPED